MKEINQLLNRYNVDFSRGFLPSEDPLLRLPKRYEEWEILSDHLTDYINAGIVRQKIDELSLIENPEFNTAAEMDRAMLLLSFFAHAYVHSPPQSRQYIPPQIAIPWIEVSKALKRKPILSHSSIVLHNWRRFDQDKPIQLDNLSTLCQFHGGLDESWFYLVTVEIEAIGAEAIPLFLQAMAHVEKAQFAKAAAYLNQANPILKSLTHTLKKMYLYCDPRIFYLRIRPFLASFDSIDYRGTGLAAQSYHGGSAAQSSLLQFLDAALGLQYKQKSTSNYLRLLRLHMPAQHAAFLSYIEKTSFIATSISKSKILDLAYKEAVNSLVAFRNEHLKIVALYIIKQAKQTQTTAIGTGGTNPMVFLKSVRDQNKDLLI
jgi:indoleamine 2,3-dioxygenase